MHLIQIMFYKPKNLSICFSPFITKEVTVLTYYTQFNYFSSILLGGFYFIWSINSKISLKSVPPKLHLHGTIWHLSTMISFHSSVSTLLSTLLTWIVKKLKWEKWYLKNNLHVDIALLQYKYMLTLAHSVHLDHNRNRKTFPYPHIFTFKSSRHRF